MAARNRLTADLPVFPNNQVPDKEDLEEGLREKYSFGIHAKIGQLLRIIEDVFSKSEWDIGKCDLVQHKISRFPGWKPVKLPNHRLPLHF